MEKKFIVWSGITLFILALAVAGCERGEREEGDEKEREEKAASPSSTPGTGAVAPAPSGGEASPGATGGKTAADKKEGAGKTE